MRESVMSGGMIKYTRMRNNGKEEKKALIDYVVVDERLETDYSAVLVGMRIG